MINSIIKYFSLRYSSQKDFYMSLKDILGFYPKRAKYYELALTHKSASILEADGTVVNNERLEYLGDAILDAIVGDYLYHKFPKEDEGFLTQMRSKIVNGDNLSELAQKIGIESYIKSQISNPKGRSKIYEDAFEAFIGAIYLDRGFMKTKEFVISRILKSLVDVSVLRDIDTNYKSQLIEWGQKYKKEVSFDTNQDTENSKLFISKVIIDKQTYGTGTGMSKKVAEQNAAKVTLDKVLVESQEDEFNIDDYINF